MFSLLVSVRDESMQGLTVHLLSISLETVDSDPYDMWVISSLVLMLTVQLSHKLRPQAVRSAL